MPRSLIQSPLPSWMTPDGTRQVLRMPMGCLTGMTMASNEDATWPTQNHASRMVWLLTTACVPVLMLLKCLATLTWMDLDLAAQQLTHQAAFPAVCGTSPTQQTRAGLLLSGTIVHMYQPTQIVSAWMHQTLSTATSISGSSMAPAVRVTLQTCTML
jgi:hypothetical protein